MQYVELDPALPKVSVISLGTWQFGDSTGTYKKQSEDVEAEIIKTALDRKLFFFFRIELTKIWSVGINLFDTAEIYNNGQAELSLGKVEKLKYFISKNQHIELGIKAIRSFST